MVLTVQEILAKSEQAANGVSFEEALKRTKLGKFHHVLIFISGIFMASVFFEIMSVNYALPVAECDLNIVSKQMYGIISGVWFAGIILSSHLWGFLSDTYGRRKILIIASLSAFLTTVLASLAANLWQLTLFRLLNGLCISGSTSTIFVYLGEFLGAKNRSRSMMISSVIFGVFCLLLPFMAWLIINQHWSFIVPLVRVTFKPWRLFILACGLPSLFCGVVVIFFPESPKFTFSQGNEEETLDIFKRIYYLNSGKRDYDVYKIKPNDEFNRKQKKENVVKMMLEQSKTLIRDYPRSIILVSMIQFGIFFVANGMLLFFPDILNQTAKHIKDPTSKNIQLCGIVQNAIELKKFKYENASTTCVDELDISAYYYAIILEACYVIGFLVISLLVNYLGRLTIFTVIFFSTGLSGVLIAFIGSPVVATYLYVWHLVCGVNNTLLNTVTYDLFPTNLRSLAMSLSLMIGRLGALLGGNIAGFLLERNCSSMFILSGVILLVSGCLTFLVPNMIKKK